jgi:hypothetical protein
MENFTDHNKVLAQKDGHRLNTKEESRQRRSSHELSIDSYSDLAN